MVVLWLTEEEFPNKERSLPKELLRFVKFGLQIDWCHNIRSYNKIIPSLSTFPDDIIVTADDDVIYPEYWLESLYNSYIRSPQEIHCHHVYQMVLDEDYSILNRKIRTTPGCLLPCEHAAGIGGILYPPHLLPAETQDTSLFLNIAPTDDDMWLWAMERIAQIPVRLVEHFTENIVCIDDVQSNGLVSINASGEGGRQFAHLLERYPILKEGLLPQKD